MFYSVLWSTIKELDIVFKLEGVEGESYRSTQNVCNCCYGKKLHLIHKSLNSIHDSEKKVRSLKDHPRGRQLSTA